MTSGTIKVSAKFDGVSLYNGDFDLCEIAEMVELTCPLKEGMHSIEVSVTVPDIAPNVSMRVCVNVCACKSSVCVCVHV